MIGSWETMIGSRETMISQWSCWEHSLCYNRGMIERSRSQDLSYRSHLNSGWFTVDHSIESMDRVGGVFHQATSAIGFNQRVSTLYSITITGFLLALDVTGRGILVLKGFGD